jgi:hypothetical protein
MANSLSSLTAGVGGVQISSVDTSGSLDIKSGTTTIVSITSAGAAVTGTLSASGATTFPAGSAAAPAITTTGDTNTGIFFPAADTIAFAEGGAEAMRIDSSGNLLINRTSAGTDVAKLSITAASAGQNGLFIDGWGSGICNGAIFRTAVSASSTCIEFKYLSSVIGGIFTTSSATSYVTSSDYRLKENIAPMTDALSTVAKLKPVTYKWKADGSDGQGFIAHELAEVVPDCVTGEKDAVDDKGKPQYQGIDTSFLVATLTAAIQEQQALIENLTTRLSALENK